LLNFNLRDAQALASFFFCSRQRIRLSCRSKDSVQQRKFNTHAQTFESWSSSRCWWVLANNVILRS